MSERNLDRDAQLVGKTNQFNLTSRRRSAIELAQFVGRDDVVALAVRLRDRFADHGLVGVVLTRVDGAARHRHLAHELPRDRAGS